MTDCEKCLSVSVCGIKIPPTEFLDFKCPQFKDANKNIKLPCDIGESLYAINGKGEIKSWEILCVRATKSRLNFNPEHIEYIIGCEKGYGGILWIDLDKTKNVYFSYEDAEKALKERNK